MPFVSRTMWIATLVLTLGSPQASLASDGGDPLPGLWQGAILVRPAVLEVGLRLELQRTGGDLQGRISFPTQSADVHELAQIDAQGPTVQWIYKDPSGDPSFFNGVLSADRRELSGTVQDGGKTLRFTLRKVDRPAAPPQVTLLSPDGAQLRARFNRDVGDVRLLMILSPTCTYCRSNAGIVQTYVLDRLQDPHLKVYVVWEHVNSADTEASANQAAALLSDGRTVHFWADHRFVGNAFSTAGGGTTASPPWDIFFTFAPRERWLDRAPNAQFTMYGAKSGELVGASPFNGTNLADRVSELLKTRRMP